jgi:methyltransferase-like protein 23
LSAKRIMIKDKFEMELPTGAPEILSTTVGDFPLAEYKIRVKERELSILHVDAMLTHADESHFLLESETPLPYGIVLWSATIALAHDIIWRGETIRGKTVLELGAGTGLPGAVADALGAKKVVQTDKNNLALTLCKRNAERNRAYLIEHRLDDWTAWTDKRRYDWIFGSDILYGLEMHEHLRRIFETTLAPGGRLLLSDPFRSGSLRLLEEMEKDGWRVAMSKYSIGEESDLRPIAVFELAPPQ